MPNKMQWLASLITGCAAALGLTHKLVADSPSGASFTELDAKARAGERIDVVFLGGSLTWGANASDPQRTSYRARVAQMLQDAYPGTQIVSYDAAIGGTGSQLAVHRLDRDVLAHNPDLVFVDFTINDGNRSDNPQQLASYEAVLRRIIAAGAPVVQVILPDKADVLAPSLEPLKRRAAHLRLAEAYGNGVGDAVAHLRQRVQAGEVHIDELWAGSDTTHPVDLGYRLYAEAAWAGFRQAIEEGRVSRLTERPLFAQTFLTSIRARVSQLGPLPEGWEVGTPNRVSAYYDMLMSRWLDDVTVARAGEDGSRPQPLRIRFRGSTVLLFGEATPESGKYNICIDGEWLGSVGEGGEQARREFDAGALARSARGNVRLVDAIASGLSTDRDHTLEIVPLLAAGQELRIESICVAGEGAHVWTDQPDTNELNAGN